MDVRKLLFWCLLVFTLMVQGYVLFFDGWSAWSHMDDVLHLAWGAVMFLFLNGFLKWRPLDALLGALCFEYLWEAGEMTTDLLRIKPVNPYPNHFFFDGLMDTVNNGLGAALAWLLVKVLGGDSAGQHRSAAHWWMVLFSLGMLPLVAVGSLVRLARGASPDTFALSWIFVAAVVLWFVAKRPFFRSLDGASRQG